jgi:hypothetical protein
MSGPFPNVFRGQRDHSALVSVPGLRCRPESSAARADRALREHQVGAPANDSADAKGDYRTEHDDALLGPVLREEVLPKHLVDLQQFRRGHFCDICLEDFAAGER